MVFESVISNLLNTYLNQFIDDLSANQLKIGAFSGHVELNNLAVKANAFDSLNLPFKVVYGLIGKLTASVPWVSLYTSPVIFNIKDVYILCVPNTECKYDEAYEKKQIESDKRKQLQSIEEAMRLADLKEKGLSDNQSDDFVSKLVAQIIRNLEIRIDNIHICYEDRFTNPKCPFSIGLTLKRLTFVTLDNLNPKYPSGKKENCFGKDVTLQFLSIYWNCTDISSFLSEMLEPDLPIVFQQRIASEANAPKLTYILKPINFSAVTYIDRKPKEDDFEIPMFDIDMSLDQFALTLNRAQIQSALLLLDSIDRMKLAAPYRKWRPSCSILKTPRLWWQFAITSILETQIRQRNKVWSWSHIKAHRKLMKEYREAYIAFMKSGKKNGQHIVDEIEKHLDVFNIILVRSGAKLELDKIAKSQAEKKEQTGWIAWAFGRRSQQEEESSTPALIDEFKKEMTKDEKAKLYQAIGYEESVPVEYPPSFEASIAGITLSTINVTVFDEQSNKNLILFKLNHVATKLGFRPSSNGLRLNLVVNDVDLKGMDGNELIINRQTNECLFELLAETNPVDKSFDYGVVMRARGIDFVYHTPTLYSVIDMLTPKDDVSLEQIQALAQIKFDQFKLRSATGLEYAIETHSTLKIDVVIEASYIIVPDRGSLIGCENILILSAGQIHVTSLPSEAKNARDLRLKYQALGEEALMKAMRGNAYDKFKLSITKTQLILTNLKNWQDDLVKSKTDKVDQLSKCHLIRPFGLELFLMKSMIDDDPEMPRLRLEGAVPPIIFKAQNCQLCRLFNLLMTLPAPEKNEPPDIIVGPRIESVEVNEAKANIDALKIAQEAAIAEIKESNVQVTNFQLVFSVEALHCDLRTDQDRELLKVAIKKVGAKVYMKSFETNADLYLGNILVQVYDLDAPAHLAMFKLIETNEDIDLLRLRYHAINRDGPTFNGVVQNIELFVARIKLSIDSPILDELLTYSQTIIDSLPSSTQTDRAIPVSRRPSISSQASLSIIQTLKVKSKVKRSLQQVKNIINLKSVISINSIELAIGGICAITLKGLVGDLSMFESGKLEAKAHWKDVSILNSVEASISPQLSRSLVHPQIIESTSERLLEVEIVMYSPSEVKRNKSVDMMCKVHFGRLKIVFLNEFIVRLFNFLAVFENAKQRALSASSRAADYAKQTAISAYESATKIGLDITLEAPLIIVPRSWVSKECMAIDLGKIVIQNEIKSEEKVLMDNIKCEITNINVSATATDQLATDSKKDHLIEPISFQLQALRNVSFTNNKTRPELELSATLHQISLGISQFNLALLISILNENLAEGKSLQPDLSQETLTSVTGQKGSKSKDKQKKEKSKKVFTTSLELPPGLTTTKIVEEAEVHVDAPDIIITEKEREVEVEAFVQYLISFAMPKIDLVLFRDDKKVTENRLTHAYLSGFDVYCKMITDGSMTAKLSISDMLIKDERSSKNDKRLRKLLYCNEYLKSDSNESKIVTVDFHQEKDVKLDVFMSGFTFVFALDFLMEISNIVTSSLQGLPKTKTESSLVPSMKDIKGVAKSTKNLVTDKNSPKISDSPVMTLCFRLSEADILMLESVELENPPVLMFNSLIEIDVKMKDDVVSLRGNIGRIQLGLTNLDNYKNEKKVENYIVTPFEINILGELSGSVSQHIDVDFTEIGLIISPNTVQTLLSILGTLGQSKEEVNTVTDEDKLNEEKSILKVTPIGDWKNYSFLMSGVYQATEATEEMFLTMGPTGKPFIMQQLIVKLRSITVTVESGGIDSLPLVKLKSSHTVILDNWSKLHLNSFAYMDYYNERTFAWEPIIETIDTEPWHFELKAKVINDDDTGSRISALMESKSQLELTLSKSAISVATDLGEAFKSAVKQLDTPLLGQNLFEFSNYTGMDLNIEVDSRKFAVHSIGYPTQGSRKKFNIEKDTKIILNNLRETASESENLVVCEIRHKDKHLIKKLSLRGRERKCFKFPILSFDNNQYNWMFELKQKDSRSKTVVFGSTVEITNHFHVPIRLYYIDITGNLEEYTFLREVFPDSSYYLPVDIVHAKYQCIFVKPTDDYCTPKEAITWNPRDVKAFTHFFSTIICESKKKEPNFYIRIRCEISDVELEDEKGKSSSCPLYKFHLYPVIRLRNLLPVNIKLTNYLFDKEHPKNSLIIKPGQEFNLCHLNLKSHKISIKILKYLNKKSWVCQNKFPIRWTKEDQIEIWPFSAKKSCEAEEEATLSIDVAINFCSDDKGCRVASVFAPFWMINKTGKTLTYKIGDQTTVHPADHPEPIMLCFKPKTLFSKKKMSLAFDDSKFSDSFSIDTVGNRGNIIAKGIGKSSYCASIEIELSDFGFTKIVTISPFYSIINKSNIDLEVSEDNQAWFAVKSKSSQSLWPDTSHVPEVYFRLTPDGQSSKPISLKDHTSILLRVGDRLIVVTVDITENSVAVQLTNYFAGSAPVQIFNTLEDVSIDYGQNLDSNRRRVPPSSSVYFTWYDTSKTPLALIWSSQICEETVVDVSNDQIGQTEQGNLFWACFLYGQQRVLVITRDELLAKSTLKQVEFNKPYLDLEINLKGIGISLVDNELRKEIAYIGITSSDVLWEFRKQNSKRFKPLSVKQIEALEQAYQKSMRRGEISGVLKIPKADNKPNILIIEGLKVDFSNPDEIKLLEPNIGMLRRNAASGVWLAISLSEHVIQFHMKVNRVQIDNQMDEYIFGIVMCPVLAPRSLTMDRAPKAFFEISTIIQRQFNMLRFNYIAILVQEFLIQIDADFLLALVEFGSLKRNRIESYEKMLRKSLRKAFEDTTDYTEIPVSSKNFYDSIHLSPIKVRVSFSLGSADAFQLLGVFDFLIKSAGVTLTEFKGVLLKIDYFERTKVLLSNEELIRLAVGHYVRQVLKQFYVVVLGLDVIGNPVGLFLGLKQGVGDFFYEPFIGIIEGPEEFAEGLALGVRSLFSHTVGGAAGALGKITGTLGDGISTLTMDQDARRKRRERINKRQTFVQSGANLLRGFATGISGVVTKPVKGCQKEGFEGLVKGLGRGVVGIFADPVTGAMDFASGSLNALQRAVDVNSVAKKQRPSRHFHVDGILRPYSLHEAQGKSLLKDIEKGRFSSENYYAHVKLSQDSIVLLTDHRIMFLKLGCICKNYDLDWHEDLENIEKIEILDNIQIHITLKEQHKKLGGLISNDKTHLIICPKSEITKWLVDKIFEIKRAKNLARHSIISQIGN